MKLGLDNVPEPLLVVATITAWIAGAVGVAMLAVVAAVPDAPQWVAIVAVAITAVAHQLAGYIGTNKAHKHVWANQKVQGFIAHAQATEPGPAAIPADMVPADQSLTFLPAEVESTDPPADLPPLDLATVEKEAVPE